MNRHALSVTTAVMIASLAACSDSGTPTPDAGEAIDVVDVPVVTDVGFDLGAPDVGVDAPDVVDAVDAVDVDNCDGGVIVDGGACLRCAAGERVCGSRCAAATDPSAGCGAASCEPCAIANAMATCTAGACALGVCNAGYDNCDSMAANGCETATRTDPANCGACGNACTLANATAGCADGACSVGTCNAGFGNCDSMAADGCETAITTSLDHCGGCGVRCAPANATAVCASGACGIATCNTGYGDCDSMVANGCEVDHRTDVNHCGGCGTRCNVPNATAACVAGACAVGACATGFADCDDNPLNGCEVNLRTDTEHCGTCVTRCTYPNAAGVCRDAACSLGACTAGFSNCDGDAANGCEIQTSSNVASCGTCGTVCEFDRATPTCTSGTCHVLRCDLNSGNCDGSEANGCEVDTGGSVNNCGACGTVCALAHAVNECNDGRCDIDSCEPNFANCNESRVDGCEVNRQTDLNNCGSCGNVCRVPHGTPSCASGACGIASCDDGWGNCNGELGDGCETNLRSADPNNCGACGVGCTEVCNAGVCQQCNGPEVVNLPCRSPGIVCRYEGSGRYACLD